MYLYWQSHPRIEGSVTHQRLRLSRGDGEEQAAGISNVRRNKRINEGVQEKRKGKEMCRGQAYLQHL
jgi:hypothetical protein